MPKVKRHSPLSLFVFYFSLLFFNVKFLLVRNNLCKFAADMNKNLRQFGIRSRFASYRVYSLCSQRNLTNLLKSYKYE